MLFLSPAELRKKRKITERFKRGTLTDEQLLVQSLEIDPFDSTALMGLGTASIMKDDREAARRYFWRALDANPIDCRLYLELTASLGDSDLELAASLMYLALHRVLRHPNGPPPETKEWLALILAELVRRKPGMDYDELCALSGALAQSQPGESERVTAILLPYRLIQEVIDRPADGMSRDTVDRIVEHGAACVPLLIGVLRAWARNGEDEGEPSAAAALALLGKIGDTAALPAIRECMNSSDRSVKVCAIWAALRLQQPHVDDSIVYTICCVPLVEAETRDEQPARAASAAQDDRIASMLTDFMRENVKPSEREHALTVFAGHTVMADLSQANQLGYVDWLLHDYTPPRFRRTIPQEYLARHSERLNRADRRALKEWAGAYCSLFEVRSVNKGVGVELTDRLLDRSLFVPDVALSNEVAPGDCLFTRIRAERDTAVGVRITSAACEEVREWVTIDRQSSGLDWLSYLRANSHRIRQRCVEAGLKPKRPIHLV